MAQPQLNKEKIPSAGLTFRILSPVLLPTGPPLTIIILLTYIYF